MLAWQCCIALLCIGQLMHAACNLQALVQRYCTPVLYILPDTLQAILQSSAAATVESSSMQCCMLS